MATGIPLEDVRNQVMTFEVWLTEQGFTIRAQESVQEKEAQPIDDQVTGMIVLALEGVKRVGAAWDTYLQLKSQAVPRDVGDPAMPFNQWMAGLGAQATMVRKDINDTIGVLQGVLAHLLLY